MHRGPALVSPVSMCLKSACNSSFVGKPVLLLSSVAGCCTVLLYGCRWSEGRVSPYFISCNGEWRASTLSIPTTALKKEKVVRGLPLIFLVSEALHMESMVTFRAPAAPCLMESFCLCHQQHTVAEAVDRPIFTFNVAQIRRVKRKVKRKVKKIKIKIKNLAAV